MCYNPTVSLGTFLFGCIIAIIVYYLNIIDKSIIILLLSFTFIQLIEFFTWTYYNNLRINRILSIIAFITIIIQLILLQYYLLEAKYRKISLSIFIVFLILFLIIQLPKTDFRMTRGKNKHLVWHWMNQPLIWLIFGLAFYIIPSYYNKYKYKSIFLFTFITLTISLYFNYKYNTWGSMWCYISNIIWIILLIKSILIFF
jgi:hypothetical protein